MVNFDDLIRHAALHRYALNIVPVASSTALEAAVSAGHEQRAPLILAPMAQSRVPGMAKALFAACEAAARDAEIPVILMGFQDAGSEESITPIHLGCNAVHVTPSTPNFPQAVLQVKARAEIAKQCGIGIGAVLPTRPEDEASRNGLPPAAECIAFAESTRVDFLEADAGAPDAKTDYERLRRVHEALGIPLLTRVGGEMPPDRAQRLIESGVALVQHFDFRAEPNAEFLADRLKLWDAAGRAAEALAHCRPLEPVAHVVEFNVPPDALPRLEEILQTGRQRLAAIPGVRGVATGEAVTAGARYRYCWIVIFANEQVVRYYRDHPLHVEFADHHFRPIAEDRLTIDFRLTGA